jgi:hypothetical protein
MDEETVRKLMQLKRYEAPPEGYFDAFLKEFHQRQRQELLKGSSISLFMERLNTYLSDPKSQGWAYAPVLAVFFVAFYCIIGMTADGPLPSVPSMALLEQQEITDFRGAITPVAYWSGGTTILLNGEQPMPRAFREDIENLSDVFRVDQSVHLFDSSEVH